MKVTNMSKSKQPVLFISDVDDTLLGEPAATRRLAHYLADECAHELMIAYASGRFFDSLKHDIENTDLPQPTYIIGGVGSDIRPFATGLSDEEWMRRMSDNWSAETIRMNLADIEGLEIQPKADQSDFKVSYYYRDATAEQLDQLRDRLAEAGIRAQLIYSSKRDLDFLPENVNKGTAGCYLAQKLDIPLKRVISAGNSGNDITLMQHGFHGIVVGNADAELRALAKDNDKIYVSAKTHADGVVDGLRYWLKSFDA